MSLRLILRVSLGVAVSLGSLYLLTRAGGLDETLTALGNVRWQAIGAVALLLSADLAIRSVRWHLLVTPVVRVSRITALGHMMIGYLANNLLPARLGEFVRAVSLADREGASRSAILATVLVDRLLDVTILAGAVLLGMVVFIHSSLMALAAITGLTIGLVGLAGLVLIGGDGRHVLWIDRLPIRRLRSSIHGLRRGLLVVRRPVLLLNAFALTAITWAVTGLAFVQAGVAVDLPLTFGQAFVMAAAINLATAIPAGPGYIGTFELAAITISAGLGVGPSGGLATGVVVHAVTLVLTTVGGIVALAALHVLPSVLGVQTREAVQMIPVTSDSEGTGPRLAP